MDWNLLSRYFMGLLCDEYAENRKIRQVGPWVGFILMGLRRAKAVVWQHHRKQLMFTVGTMRFKVRFHHEGKSSGIRIVKILPGRGNPMGHTVVHMRSLADAEQFYQDAPAIFGALARGRVFVRSA